MATNILKLVTILFLAISIFLSLHPRGIFSFEIEDDEEDYVLDNPLVVVPNFRSRSRFLSHGDTKGKIRKGAHCDPNYHNICNGVSVNNGTGLLYCCKKHCRNVLRDRNNCGRCDNRCKFGQRCCGGVCTDVLSNANHCGKCDKQCSSGVKCEFGYCGYA